MADEYSFAVFEGVNDNGPGVPKADLEDGLFVLVPPAFAYCGVIVSENEEMAYYWKGAWDF